MVSLGLERLATTFTMIAAFAALAGCDDSTIAPLSGTSASTAVRPSINLQVTPTVVTAGQKVTLQWIADYSQSCAASGGWNGTQPTSGTLAMLTPATNTSYTLTCTGQGGSAAQSASVTVNPPAPSITLSANRTTVAAQGIATLSWTATAAKTCMASGGWQGTMPTSGQWTTGKLTSTTEFELACTGAGGTTTQSTTVTVSPPAPTVTIQANPSTVAVGGSSVISWSAQNVTTCSSAGAWSGPRASSGSMTTGPLDASSTYTLACSGPGGSASQSATVSIGAQAPSVVLSANPSTVAQGGTSSLSWSSSNATSCTASGAWSGAKAVKGSQSVGPLSEMADYTLSCVGGGGSAVQTATISVKSPAPTLSLSVGPSAIASGGSATLTWLSANATSCTASGGWAGTKSLSGSQSTGALTANATYVLTCAGAGGSATQSASVSVKAPAPTISLSASPSSITSGSASMLTWSGTNSTACTASGAWNGAKAASGTQSTGALQANSTYVLTCTGPGGNAVQSTTVTVTQGPTATVQLSASPSTITSGGASMLSWTTTNASSCTASGAWSGSKATSGSQSTGALQSNATYSLRCAGTGGGGSATQATTVSVTQPAATVSISASPSTVTSGSSSLLTWSSTNASACSASGGWSGPMPLSGSQSTGALKANATYVLTCTGAGGSAMQSASVAVTSPAPAPTVRLSSSPSTIVSGGSATLSWSTSNATACTASGAWSGSQATSGSQSTGALKASSTYVLTCTGAGGSATQSATVTVSTPAPTVTLAASPSSIASGGTSALAWTSTNASACVASGGWSGAKAISGSQSTGALTASATYTLTCSGAGGSAAQSATVTVTAAAPTVTLSANPTTVATGATSTLTWSTTNASACVASGGWSGTEAISGSQPTTALTAATKYTLTCTGAGGSSAQAVTVSVTAPAPTVTLSASPSSVSSGGSSTLTWSAANATACTVSGGWSGTLATSGSKSTGALSAPTTYTLSCTGTGGSASQSATVAVSGSTSGPVQRPSYNTGNGFFVLNGKLYDANGNAFRIRGVDRAHYDSNSAAGIALSKANAVRIFIGVNYGQTWPGLANIIQTQHIAYDEVPIPVIPSTTAGTATSCSTDPSVLASVVANWVANAAVFTPMDREMIVNIANEWGPSDSSVWASSYISAVQQMRAAGYLGTLLIDAGGCGQDELDLNTYAAQVLAADPQHNLMFAFHLYGGTTPYQAPIASASGEVITLDSDSATHPFAPTYNGTNNSYSGITQMVIQSPSGTLTTIPVKQNVGGTPGAWTVTATAPLPAIAAGSTLYDWGNYQMRIPRLAALASQGIAVAITEFGPGNNIGPSPTVVTPREVVSTAEASQIGWAAWAWDDNNLANCQSNNSWFSMTYNCGEYSQASDLTTYGQEIVLDPTYGLSVLATPASIFE